MKITTAEFERSAPDLKSCPSWARPEFAFIGRSNVGKSSLINLLCERKALAKVSDLPGKTQLINFFIINGRWCLVDLPGYGYASVAKQRRADFNEAVAEYLRRRETLKRVFVLIDSRHSPQAIDLEFLAWLAEGHVPFALVFTKCDKQSANQTEANILTIQRALAAEGVASVDAFRSSSTTRTGRGEILAYIERALRESSTL